MITLVFEKKDLLYRINTETVYLSNPVMPAKDVYLQRLPEVLPLTKEDESFFESKLYESATRVFQKLAYKSTCVDSAPFLITDDTFVDFPNSVIFRLELYEDANKFVILPLLQQYISEALIKYIIMEWLKTRGYMNYVPVIQVEYENSLSNIKSSLQYGQKTKLKYVQL